MKQRAKIFFLIALSIGSLGYSGLIIKNNLPKEYKGQPFKDSVYKAGAQIIPGRIQCALFDLGGEGVGYHDTDSINRGSGEYNYQPGHCELGSDYVCHFREKEGVDLSYTKEFLDFNHPNPFTPDRRQMYIGWTKDGESCNYTVNVKNAGTYKVGILYSNEACQFKLLVNNNLAGNYIGPIKTASYHTWNKADSVGTITFKNKGLNLLTLQYAGGSNYAYIDVNFISKRL